jgi:hypothetical protein
LDLIAKKPGHPLAHAYLGRLYLDLGLTKSAAEAFRTLRAPANPHLQTAAGQLARSIERLPYLANALAALEAEALGVYARPVRGLVVWVPFVDRSKDRGLSESREALTELCIQAVNQGGKYRALPREETHAYLLAMGLTRGNGITPAQAQRLVQLAGAQYVIFGHLTKDKYVSGKLILAANPQLPGQTRMAKKIIANLGRAIQNLKETNAGQEAQLRYRNRAYHRELAGLDKKLATAEARLELAYKDLAIAWQVNDDKKIQQAIAKIGGLIKLVKSIHLRIDNLPRKYFMQPNPAKAKRVARLRAQITRQTNKHARLNTHRNIEFKRVRVSRLNRWLYGTARKLTRQPGIKKPQIPKELRTGNLAATGRRLSRGDEAFERLVTPALAQLGGVHRKRSRGAAAGSSAGQRTKISGLQGLKKLPLTAAIDIEEVRVSRFGPALEQAWQSLYGKSSPE